MNIPREKMLVVAKQIVATYESLPERAAATRKIVEGQGGKFNEEEYINSMVELMGGEEVYASAKAFLAEEESRGGV